MIKKTTIKRIIIMFDIKIKYNQIKRDEIERKKNSKIIQNK